MSRSLPSALIRSQSSGGAPERQPRREPSPAQLAMMTADQLKSYHERKGTWGMTPEQREQAFPFANQPTARTAGLNELLQPWERIR
jgi:hypothetical protein